MNKLHTIGILGSLLAFGFGTAASSAAMSNDEYRAGHERIAADYKATKASCDSFAGNAKDICVAEAKGRERVRRAELEAEFKPTARNRYDLGIARAAAEYAVAKERCDDKAGTAKSVCLKEAKAAETRAKADAKANLTVTKADAAANEKATVAHKEAAEDKREADYAVAKAKCDSLAGEAKDRCVMEAKARYGG